MKKVLICDPMPKDAIDIMKNGGLEVVEKTEMTPEELVATVADYEAMIVRSATKVTKEVIDAGSKLEVIGRGGVGLDNIDVAHAVERGIKVLNTPSAPSISVAEITIGHLLALARHIVRGTMGLKTGKWEKKQLKGFEAYGKTLGIIGIGRIGQEVAIRAIGLGMKVQAYDPFTCCTNCIQAPQINTCSFEQLIRESDVITVHTPLTDGTRNLIGAKEFENMKDGVVIINCSRGGIIDEQALLDALQSGKVRGACLDVFEQEPPGDNPLLTLDNVIATPHIGSATVEGQARVGTEIATLVVQALKC